MGLQGPVGIFVKCDQASKAVFGGRFPAFWPCLPTLPGLVLDVPVQESGWRYEVRGMRLEVVADVTARNEAVHEDTKFDF